jgi:hypothetical protein
VASNVGGYDRPTDVGDVGVRDRPTDVGVRDRSTDVDHVGDVGRGRDVSSVPRVLS